MKTRFKKNKNNIKNNTNRINSFIGNINFINNQNYILGIKEKKKIFNNLLYYFKLSNKQKFELWIHISNNKWKIYNWDINEIKKYYIIEFLTFVFWMNFLYLYLIIENIINFNLVNILYFNIIVIFFLLIYLHKNKINESKYLIYKDRDFIKFIKK